MDWNLGRLAASFGNQASATEIFPIPRWKSLAKPVIIQAEDVLENRFLARCDMAWNFRKASALACLGLGLVAGLVVAGLCPSVPLHAVATDKIDTFSMATGAVEGDYEAVYFLDHLSGDLHAYVIGRMARGGFGVLQHGFRNVIEEDFKTDGDKTPKFLMLTGISDLNRRGTGGNALPSRAVVYVADVTSGAAVAYALPFNTTQHNAGMFVETPLVPICKFPIRKVAPKAGRRHAAATSE